MKNRKTVRYPWKQWFALGKFRLIKGVHFNGRTTIMAQMVRNAKQRYCPEKKVSIHIQPDESYLLVRVLDEAPTRGRKRKDQITAA